MITHNSFTKDWLLSLNRSRGWNRAEAQLKNVEKAIVALHLLECMAQTNLEFIFKGGTALLLLLGRIYRLSVDIDLIVEDMPADLDAVLTQACATSHLFSRFERQERGGDEILSTQHFKFFYSPFADDAEESYILLDLYPMANPYAKTIELEVAADILNLEGNNVSVRLPDVDCLLADKLTAFAPNTIGISLTAEPGHRPKRVEALKQLYDIGLLFDRCQDVAHIHRTYWTIAQHEIEHLGLALTPEDVLKDSTRWAVLIGHGGLVDQKDYQLLSKGFKDFNKFVADMSFSEQEAVFCASKVAYLAHVLLSGAAAVEKYDDELDMGNWVIMGPSWSKFNDYKYSNPAAFFYWMRAIHNS